MEATITLEYADEKTAKAIASAVSPDNFKTPPGLNVKTMQNGKQVHTTINATTKISTFIATIDDLLSSVHTAEKTIGAIRRDKQ